MKAENELHCRVVIIGDSAVGKTSILNRIVSDVFNPYELSTVGANYQLITRTIDGRSIEIQVWDTAGQEKFRSLSPIYFRNAIAAIAVYDQTSKQSFLNLDNWIKMFTDIAGTDSIIMVAANKCDLTDQIEVNLNDAMEKCNESGYMFCETSAQSGEGVHELFNQLSSRLVDILVKRKKTSDSSLTPTKKSNCGC